MITFLPDIDFKNSAEILDWRRLSKQRIDAFHILMSLRTYDRFYLHPAVRMWIGYETALCLYGRACCEVFINAGNDDSLMERFTIKEELVVPPWLGGPIHASHRAALLFKNFKYYSQYNWLEIPQMAYHWPGVDSG